MYAAPFESFCLRPAKTGVQLADVGDRLISHANWAPAFAGARGGVWLTPRSRREVTEVERPDGAADQSFAGLSCSLMELSWM